MTAKLSPGAALAVARWNKPGAGRTVTSVPCETCGAKVGDRCRKRWTELEGKPVPDLTSPVVRDGHAARRRDAGTAAEFNRRKADAAKNRREKARTEKSTP